MTDNLKPCPFCGDPAVLDTYYDFYRVRCDYPECPGNVKNGDGIWYGTIEHAVQRWNTRVERTCEMNRVKTFPGTDSNFVCWICSACGKTNDEHEPNYCPNCGAKVVSK